MIRLNGKFERCLQASTYAEITFKIPLWQAKQLDADKEKLYRIELKEAKSKKSINQNNFLWALLTEIDREENIPSDIMGVYSQRIKDANVKTVFLEGLEETKTMLLKTFRVVEIREYRTSSKGIKTCLFECYYGSSDFNKEEMTKLIEVTLNHAIQIGLDVERIREVIDQ